MIQNVKTTIRWQDSDGNVLGAVFSKDMDLPSWGKKKFMRDEIVSCIKNIIASAANTPKQPKNFEGYAFNAFRTGKIIQIKSKTVGSYINLRDNDLSHFMETYGL